MLSFLVHNVIGNANRAAHQHLARTPSCALFFDLAQDCQRETVIRADQTRAMAVRTRLRRSLYHTRAQTLTAHFHQTKTRNPTNLNSRAVSLKLVFQTLFNCRVILALLHVDKVDDDQTSQITQPQLARDLFGGLKICLEGRILDRRFFGRPARVYIDRHQRFGHTNHDVAPRSQLDDRVEHGAQIAFHLIPGEQWHGFSVVFHIFCVRRHDHFHEVFRNAIPTFPFDQNLIDLAVIKIAD